MLTTPVDDAYPPQPPMPPKYIGDCLRERLLERGAIEPVDEERARREYYYTDQGVSWLHTRCRNDPETALMVYSIALGTQVHEMGLDCDIAAADRDTVEEILADVGRWFRDDVEINIFRVLNDMTADGAPVVEGDVSLYDPVVPESRQSGGTADFREGDTIRCHDGEEYEVERVGEDVVRVSVEDAGIAEFTVAELRNLFLTGAAALARDGNVVRGTNLDLEAGYE